MVTLKITWNIETRIYSDIGSLEGNIDTKRFTAGSLNIRMMAVKITVPITLKVKCIKATLLEFALAPTDARSAVTQVPIFAPKTMKSARSRGNTPVPTIVIKTPVDADELCIKAVKITPTFFKTSVHFPINTSRKLCVQARNLFFIRHISQLRLGLFVPIVQSFLIIIIFSCFLKTEVLKC